MPAAIPFVVAAASIAGSVASVAGPLLQKNKPQPVGMKPDAPSAAGAADQAKQQLDKKRRISLLQGSNTDVTRGTAAVGTTNVGGKSLLGN